MGGSNGGEVMEGRRWRGGDGGEVGGRNGGEVMEGR